MKYRLENLTRKQKKILCDLFVDRVEMFRKERRKELEYIGGNILSVQPSKVLRTKTGVEPLRRKRTTKKPSKAQKREDGGRERT